MAESKDGPLAKRLPSQAQILPATPMTESTSLKQATEDTEGLTTASKTPTTFLDLPAELRNRIYDLSGCLKVHQYRKCNLTVFGDSDKIRHEHRSDIKRPCRRSKGSARDCKLYDWPFLDCWCRKTFTGNLCGHAARATLMWINRKPYHSATTHHQSKVINAASLESVGKSMESLPEAENCACEVEEINEASVASENRSKMHPKKIAREHWAKMKRGTHSVLDDIRAHPGRLSIAQGCKDLRREVLSIYYASAQSYATLFDMDIDGAAILQWLDSIGPVNAAHLSSFYIVYSQKKHLHYIEMELVPAMVKAGVRPDHCVLEVTKLKPPFCQCEYCTVQTLREKTRDSTTVLCTHRYTGGTFRPIDMWKAT